MSRLYWVRHGENRANSLQIFSCKYVDFPLTSKGAEQARRAGSYLHKARVQRVCSSPLKRAAETAEIIADHLNLSVTVVDSLIEVDVGRLEGQRIDDESKAFYYGILGDWLAGRSETAFPDGEDGASFYGRAESALTTVVPVESSEDAVVVGHSGFFKAASKLLCSHLDPEWVLTHPYPNCAISAFKLAKPQGRLAGKLLGWGRSDHLAQASA